MIKNKNNLIHYKDTESLLTKRLNSFYSQLILFMKYNNISQLNKFTEKIAFERFNSGFSLFEILSNIAIISTIFGELKDEIACIYVKLSENNKEKSFNTESLFEGTERPI